MIYQEFIGVFEKIVEKLIERCGVSVQDFVGALQRAIESDISNKFHLEMILSLSEYKNFCEMMCTFKRELKKAEEESEGLKKPGK